MFSRSTGFLIHCIVCQAVTTQTSSMATMVSKNNSKPSLWCGVVNLNMGVSSSNMGVAIRKEDC